MKKKILSLFLTTALLFTQIAVFAEGETAEDTTTGEETADTITYTLSPENYAVIHVAKDGYADHTKYAKDLNLYYNTPYDGNSATIHITKEGYASHIKYAKKLGVYYNKTYNGLTYSEFGSLISGYRVPLRDTLTEMKIQYYVTKGGMQSGIGI